jgi:hypothetical protein
MADGGIYEFEPSPDAARRGAEARSAANRQERALLDALGATRTWRVTADTLILSGQRGPLARFSAQ